tara:strand:+ start:1908 stop:2732 length:825 start_codon:yes stop_codon:yes gene_type:complete
MREIKLEKKIFGTRESRDYLDEEFTELKIKNYTPSEFFELYDDLFYDIEKEGKFSHSTIVYKSTEYVGTPPNLKDQEILDFKEQVIDVQFEIDSIEEEHPFLPNLSVLQVRNEPSLKYYMQSGRRRQIKSDNILKSIKEQTRTPDGTPDEVFCILLNADAILGILPGPDIEVESDLTTDIAMINRYNQGGSLNDPLADINVAISKPDLKNTTIVPETGMYNPMANIEEPPLPPGGLTFTSNNTDSFNNNQLSLNEWRAQKTDFNTRGGGTDSTI